MKLFLKISVVVFLLLFNCKQVNRTQVMAGKIQELEFRGLNERISNDISEFSSADYIKRQAERFIKRHEMAGMSIAVIKDEKLVYAKGFGFADIENKQEVNPGNLFRLASISKLITAVGILKLVEDGRLTLDSKVFGPDAILNDSVFTVVRDRRLKDITVRHLLAHSGGWSQRYGDPAFSSRSISSKMGDPAPATMQTYYKYVASRRLHFTPGTRVSYSNMGYMFLGKVIERVSGKDYDNYIRNEILIPNGITDMYIGSSFADGRRPNEVKYYEQRGSLPVPCFDGSGKYVPKSYGGNPVELIAAAGGWIASSVELAKLLVLIDGWQGVKDIVPDSLMDDMLSTKYAEGHWAGVR